MSRLNVELKDTMYEEFQKRSSIEGRSMSDVVRSLIVDWITKKRREDFQSASMAVTDEEVEYVG